jgi:hypothetical protein
MGTPDHSEADAERVAALPTEPVVLGRTRTRTLRTRRTVDLSPAQHRALDIWQRDAADRLGIARVTGQEVLATLVDQLLSDPNLGAQITRTIRARR